ncbi:hypothetical protein BDW69DRAFT_201531 [Aspergillus filifer]
MDRPPPAKRPRLSMACNICRQRKVKCDAEYPKCRNCRVRNQSCITTDPQRPGCPGVREWLELPDKVHNGDTQGATKDIITPNQAHPASHPPTSLPDAVPETGVENEVSPVRQPFDTSINTEQGTNRTKILGGSSSQCLAKSLDVYFKAVRMKPVSGFFRHGMRHAEELDIPLALMLPELPNRDRRNHFLSTYRFRVHPLYPIFDLDALSTSIDQLASVPKLSSLPRDEIPLLVSAYLVMSIGLDEESQYPTEEGDRYLHAAASLLSHVILVPYLPAVQTLLLFTIAYRGHNQEGLAWQHLGMAIRTAYTLGLHRQSSRAISDDDLHIQIWAACCSFEKVMHLASGWPTLVPDHLMANPDSLSSTKSRFLQWHLGLAHYQGSVSHHLYSHQPSTQHTTQRPTNGPRSISEILLDTARLDRALLAWANGIPAELRPGNDIICATDEFHIIAFLSMEYHGTMIALHRAALIAPKAKIEDEVEKHCANDPSKHRLANGESICVNSARAIIKLSIELQDRGSDSCLIPAGTAGLACIALAIYLLKHPSSRLQATDLQLLKAGLSYSSTQFAQCNIDPRYIEGLAMIYEQIHARLVGSIPEQPHPSPLPTHQQTRYPTYLTHKPNASLNALGTLPTPSTHLPTSPASARIFNTDRMDSSSSVPRRAQSFSHPVPHQGTLHAGADWPNTDQDFLLNNSNNTSGNIFHDSAIGSNDSDISAVFNEVYPFEGFNVEELWNWMLYFDSPKSTDVS